MVTNLLLHHWREVWWIDMLRIFLHFTYLILLWWTQSNWVVLIQLMQGLLTEIPMMIVLGVDYFASIENYRDWIKIAAAVSYLTCSTLKTDGSMRMLHFVNEDYWEDWNTINVEGMAFAILIAMQWFSIIVTLQSWKEMRILNKVIE